MDVATSKNTEIMLQLGIYELRLENLAMAAYWLSELLKHPSRNINE